MSRLVYVVEAFPVLSQTFIQNEIRALSRLGVAVSIFSMYPVHDDVDPTAGDLPSRRLPSPRQHLRRVVGALLWFGVRHPLRSLVVAARVLTRPSRLQFHSYGKALLLAAELRSDPPRRIHAHFARASASAAMHAAALVGARFSFTAHAVDIFWRPLDVDRKLRHADLAITVCDYNLRYIERQWPGLGRLVVVPCGVDPDVFRREQPHLPVALFSLVAVGRLVEKKGFHVLVEAAAVLRRRGEEVVVRIIGDGPERSRLAALAEEHGLETTVALLWALPPVEVRRELEAASAFCLPCLIDTHGNRDSQPVVIKEAMALELPIIATSEVGIPEMVDSTTGLLVPPNDPVALADAIVAMSRLTDEARREMGRRARARVEERFTVEGGARALLAAWDARDPGGLRPL